MERDREPLPLSLETVKEEQGLLREKLHARSLKCNHFIYFEKFQKNMQRSTSIFTEKSFLSVKSI